MVGITMQSCAAEFVGTFLLVFAVGCNVLGENGTWGGVSIACTLMVSIYALGDASGANFNPAVSVALGLAKKMDESWKQVGVYCGVQVLAACVAALCYGLLFQGGFQLAPKEGLVIGAILCELFYTFMLCFVVLNVAASDSEKIKGNQFFGFAIGFVIIAGAYGSAPLGAGCFNPAVAIGITASGLFGGFGWCLLYCVIELAGAALAVGAFWLVRPEEKDKSASADSLQSKLIGEGIGTFMLVLTVGLNVLGSSKAAAFSIAASLACMIYAIGDISGGHFNPAVTTAILCSGKDKIEKKEACFYMLTQCGAAILAAIAYTSAHGGATFALGPNDGWGWCSVMCVEAVFTMVLAMVVLCVAFGPPEVPQMLGFAIASCVTAGGFAAGPISGGSLNPAVSVGIAAADIVGGGLFYKAVIYSAAEILGGVAAAGVFRVVYGGLLEGLGKGVDLEAGKETTKAS